MLNAYVKVFKMLSSKLLYNNIFYHGFTAHDFFITSINVLQKHTNNRPVLTPPYQAYFKPFLVRNLTVKNLFFFKRVRIISIYPGYLQIKLCTPISSLCWSQRQGREQHWRPIGSRLNNTIFPMHLPDYISKRLS